MKPVEFLWLPTLKCPYRCAYCNARKLPKPYQEHSAEEWINAFKNLKRPVDRMIISGGEPTVFKDLDYLLEEMQWNFHINTNLAIHPSKWLTDENKKYCSCISSCLQFGANSPQAEQYIEHAKWIAERIEDKTDFTHHFVKTQQTDQTQQGNIVQLFRDNGFEVYFDEFDDTWLWDDWLPRKNIKAMCSGGMDYFCVYVDGRAYRCTGCLWSNVNSIGNVFEKNIEDILYTELKECSEGLCIEVPMCEIIQTNLIEGDKSFISDKPKNQCQI